MVSRVAKVISSAPIGLKGVPIEIECDLNNGLPGMTIVGLGAKAVDEAKERVKSALLNSGLQLPKKRITINLSPADLPKDGASFDLPIALALMQASSQIPEEHGGQSLAYVGELALDGRIKPVPGIIVHLESAKAQGISHIIIPAGNRQQAGLVHGITILPAEHLKQIYQHLTDVVHLSPLKPTKRPAQSANNASVDLQDVAGQAQAKRALEIAAAGHHNILMTGPPGTGKTMLAQALTGLLPPLRDEEIITITNLHSLAQINKAQVVAERPFRSPHHTASAISVIGGGRNATPGEVSLAHGGVLFLDELPEYPRSVLESLRQPLEDRMISIARANRRVVYPADFMLVSTQNPCPCGYYGDPQKDCTCSAHQIAQYQKRISGPLLDRIDVIIEVDRIESAQLFHDDQSAESSRDVQQRVTKTRSLQLARNGGKANSQLSSREIKLIGQTTTAAQQILERAIDGFRLSPRGAMRTLKVARTIADLEGSVKIDTAHMSEALQYRVRETTTII